MQMLNHRSPRAIRTMLVGLTLGMLVTTSLLAPPPAAAQTIEWGGTCVYSPAGSESQVATIQGLECLIANVFIVFITIIGLAAFVMFIIASFRWMLSGGNTKNVEAARNTFTFAIVGIVVALSAFIILNLISAFTGIDIIREFRIPSSEVDTANPGGLPQPNPNNPGPF